MRPKSIDISIDKSGAFRWKRMLKGFLVFDVFGSDDDMQRPAGPSGQDFARYRG